MNADLAPAVVAAGGGSLLMVSILGWEAKRTAAMRASRERHSLIFPPLSTADGEAMLQALSGLGYDNELILETAADHDSVRHGLWVPLVLWPSVRSSLSGLLPGLRLVERPPLEGVATFQVKVQVPTPVVLATDHPEAASRALLAGLASLASGERVVIRWALRPSYGPQVTADEKHTNGEAHKLWRKKVLTSGGGFQVSGLVLVQARSLARARQLGEHIASCLRSRRGGVDGLRLRRQRAGRSLTSMPTTKQSSGWLNASELLGIAGLPVGEEVPVGVEVSLTRQVPPRPELARHGRPLFVADRHGQSVPVALDFQQACARHVAVLGASGGGKSTLIARGILSHIAAGHAGLVLDPKGDLVSAVIEHANEGAERIVVLDPSAAVVPGVDLFGRGDPDLRSEVLVSVFRSLFKDVWGPRSDDYLRLGVRTLAGVPDATLLDLSHLFLDARARRRAVGFLDDPLLIGQWQALERLSEAESAQHLQAPLSRVMNLITRPAVQAVFGPGPTLDVGRLLDSGGWLLVPLPSGVIGSGSSRIIASALAFLVWSHIAARVAVPPQARKLLCLFLDETQALTDQGIGLEDMLEQARGYNASVTIATQALGRMPDQLRHSLLSNVGTLIAARAGATEAATISRELVGLSAQDIQSLPPFHVAAKVATGSGSGSVVVTGRTLPLGEPTGQASRILARSAERYGRSREQVQAAIRERYGMAPSAATDASDEDEVGKLRRQA